MKDYAQQPVIRLELEHIKHSLLNAFISHSDEMSKLVQAAIDEHCSEQAVLKELQKHAGSAVNGAIKDELNKFFTYGEGRSVIRAALAEAFKSYSESTQDS